MVNRSSSSRGQHHEDLSAVAIDGRRRHRAVRLARGHVHRRRELRLAARARSTARTPSTPARRCRQAAGNSWRRRARAPTRAGSRASSSPTSARRRCSAACFEVADNAPGAPQTVATLSGLGTLTATCNDQNAAAGNEDPISSITFLNQSGEIVNVARRVGNADGALSVAAEPDRVVARDRRLEHVHVPHRAPLAERDRHRRRAPGRPRHARRDLRRLRRRDAVLP